MFNCAAWHEACQSKLSSIVTSVQLQPNERLLVQAQAVPLKRDSETRSMHEDKSTCQTIPGY